MSVEVRLPAFEGPLDLLLHLIEKNKIDITDIPIYEITQQYLACLDEWNRENMEVASEFIVMAAELINIKARMLLPVESSEEEEEDPRDELVSRLLEYKRYKEAAVCFRLRLPDPQALWIERSREVIRIRPRIPKPEELLGDVSVDSLYELYRSIIRSKSESIDPIRSSFRSVAHDTFSIDEKIRDLMSALEALHSLSFYQLRSQSHSRTEEITYFLAMLELNRSNIVQLRQKSHFEDIEIVPVREESVCPEEDAPLEEEISSEEEVPPEENAPLMEEVPPEENAPPEELIEIIEPETIESPEEPLMVIETKVIESPEEPLTVIETEVIESPKEPLTVIETEVIESPEEPLTVIETEVIEFPEEPLTVIETEALEFPILLREEEQHEQRISGSKKAYAVSAG